jgi:hypothetical protein
LIYILHCDISSDESHDIYVSLIKKFQMSMNSPLSGTFIGTSLTALSIDALVTHLLSQSNAVYMLFEYSSSVADDLFGILVLKFALRHYLAKTKGSRRSPSWDNRLCLSMISFYAFFGVEIPVYDWRSCYESFELTLSTATKAVINMGPRSVRRMITTDYILDLISDKLEMFLLDKISTTLNNASYHGHHLFLQLMKINEYHIVGKESEKQRIKEWLDNVDLEERVSALQEALLRNPNICRDIVFVRAILLQNVKIPQFRLFLIDLLTRCLKVHLSDEHSETEKMKEIRKNSSQARILKTYFPTHVVELQVLAGADRNEALVDMAKLTNCYDTIVHLLTLVNGENREECIGRLIMIALQSWSDYDKFSNTHHIWGPFGQWLPARNSCISHLEKYAKYLTPEQFTF